MPYKTFIAGDEALASDVNALLMSQSIARFPTAAARAAAGTGITAPAVNQLSMLDDRPGVIQRWTGSAWADMGTCLRRTTTQNFGGVIAGVAQDLTMATFTMPFQGTVFLDGMARTDPGAGASSVGIVILIDASPTSVPVASITPQYVQAAYAANFAYAMVPFSYKFNNVAAGTACTLKIRMASNNPSMGFQLTSVTSTVMIVPAEF